MRIIYIYIIIMKKEKKIRYNYLKKNICVLEKELFFGFDGRISGRKKSWILFS